VLVQLGSDEHAWVDFKEDYEIGGIGPKKAEFIRDISSLANTITNRDEHYLFIGVDDDGDIVGITPGRENYRGSGPRHIFSYDESDIQEIVDSNLETTPTLSWHTFEEDGNQFGVLGVKPLTAPPAVTVQHINDDSGHRLLHEGLVFVRKGSGKKIAGREDLERILKYRIEKQREQILDGVHKAIDLGPEWIDRIGQALPEEPGIPLTTTEDPDEADVKMTQRITREPASTLDNQLNEDISQWRGRGDDFIERQPLYEYYTHPSKLRLNEIALKFLTQSAIKNYHLGIFWLDRTDADIRRKTLLATPDKHHRTERAGKALLLMNDKETFETLIERSTTDDKRGDLRMCNQRMGNTVRNRINCLLKSDSGYQLKHDTWTKEFQPKDLEIDEIRELIPQVARQLIDLQKLYEQRKLWHRTDDFRDALWDLEVVLGAESFS
jgi:hypothetical protein